MYRRKEIHSQAIILFKKKLENCVQQLRIIKWKTATLFLVETDIYLYMPMDCTQKSVQGCSVVMNKDN